MFSVVVIASLFTINANYDHWTLVANTTYTPLLSFTRLTMQRLEREPQI